MTSSRTNTGIGLLIAMTIATSAFISFSLQPMIGKILLPQAGGSPATWNSAMMVYQILLLSGYLWAALLAKLAFKIQALLHTALGATCLFLPFLVPVTVEANAGELYFTIPQAIFQIAGIGMLFLFSQGPLLQSWYSRVAPDQNPYRLYVASNLGSFGGLFAYPILLEPNTDLSLQSAIYTSLFVAAIAITIALSAFIVLRAPKNPLPQREKASYRSKLEWALIPFVTTGLMMAITAHITTDIAAMPLTWAVPLGIYLLSYGLAFSDRNLGKSPRLTIFSLVFLAALSFGGIQLNWIAVVLELLFFAVVITMLHRQLYNGRPDAEDLTRFYLHMAFGGALAGIAIGIFAPITFNWIYELPLFVAAAILVLRVPSTEKTIGNTKIIKGIWFLAILMTALSAIVSFFSKGTDYVSAIIAVIVGINAGALSGYNRKTIITLSVMAMIAGGAFTQFYGSADSKQLRNYFGVSQVVYTENRGEPLRALLHGTTMHGVQVLEEDGRPSTTTYYGPDSGIKLVIDQYERPVNAIVLGLGAGTIACTFPEGSDLTFIEIDPDMVDIARNDFTFLRQCNAKTTKVLVGDGRQEMDQLPGQAADIFLMDAFSSDSIPTHLITQEALNLARTKLKKDGTLVIHISNRYLDLAPMLAAYADSQGLEARSRYIEVDERTFQSATHYVAIAPKSVIERYAPASDGWITIDKRTRMWTDEYSSVVQALR